MHGRWPSIRLTSERGFFMSVKVRMLYDNYHLDEQYPEEEIREQLVETGVAATKEEVTEKMIQSVQNDFYPWFPTGNWDVAAKDAVCRIFPEEWKRGLETGEAGLLPLDEFQRIFPNYKEEGNV